MSDETNNANTNPQPAAQQPAPEEAQAELTINDLAAMKSIIDVASQRGAFKPNEMVPVGTVYAKLEKFLASATKGSANA